MTFWHLGTFFPETILQVCANCLQTLYGTFHIYSTSNNNIVNSFKQIVSLWRGRFIVSTRLSFFRLLWLDSFKRRCLVNLIEDICLFWVNMKYISLRSEKKKWNMYHERVARVKIWTFSHFDVRYSSYSRKANTFSFYFMCLLKSAFRPFTTEARRLRARKQYDGKR